MCLDHKKTLKNKNKTIQYTGPSSFVIWQRNLTIKGSDARRMKAVEMKYMRRTAGYTWTDYKANAQIAMELKITQILDKLLEYKRKWIQHANRMPRNRLPRIIKHYSPTGRRNQGRPLKRLLDTWDRNGSTSDPTPWKIYDGEFGLNPKKKQTINEGQRLELRTTCNTVFHTLSQKSL